MAEADFTKIRQDLELFLKDNSDFTDYNFEGSALSTLVNILAYNEQNLSLKSNLTFSETFLDSANQRSSVVSRAKEIGYVPHSSSAATANIGLTFSVTGNPSQYVIPKNTIFSSVGDTKTYQFITTEDAIVSNVSNTFSADLDIVQGKLSTYSYTVDTSDLIQKYVIPSKTVDLSHVIVAVNGTSYTKFEDTKLGDISGDSLVYYIFENIDGYFEIYFGDGILGKSVSNGDVILLTYLITEEDTANYLKKFTLTSTLSGVSSVSIVTNDYSFGGGSKETIESIKFNAPLSYQKQNRAVTRYDYISLIKNSVSGIDDVNVWGGEDNVPPYYGKVFIALKPSGSKYISSIYKEKIKALVKSNYSIVTARPEVVDGDYTDVGVDCTISYSGKRYNPLTDSSLNTTVEDAIIAFFDNYGNKFGETIYHSSLLNSITNSSDLILNAIVNFSLTKYNKVYFGISGEYTYSFNNYVAPDTIRSNSFVVGGVTYSLRDSPSGSYPYTTGVIEAYSTTASIDVGTINYTTGDIVISNTIIDYMSDGTTELAITVNQGSFVDNNSVFSDYNVYTNKRDQLVRLLEQSINIVLLPDNTR